MCTLPRARGGLQILAVEGGGPKFSKQGGVRGGSKNFPPTVESTEISRFPIVYDTADYIYDAHFLKVRV